MSKRSISGDFVNLREAVREYLSECDNPVADYGLRRTLRNRLRRLVDAPDEPRPSARAALSREGVTG